MTFKELVLEGDDINSLLKDIEHKLGVTIKGRKDSKSGDISITFEDEDEAKDVVKYLTRRKIDAEQTKSKVFIYN